MAKIRSIMLSSAPIAFRIAMSLDFSMIIMMSVATMTKAATTLIIVSSRNIIVAFGLERLEEGGEEVLPVARDRRDSRGWFDTSRPTANGSGRSPSCALRCRR